MNHPHITHSPPINQQTDSHPQSINHSVNLPPQSIILLKTQKWNIKSIIMYNNKQIAKSFKVLNFQQVWIYIYIIFPQCEG